MINLWRQALPVFFLLACFSPNDSVASIIISGTRVIYPSESKEVVVQLSNSGTKPVLVQAWIGREHDDVTPEKAKAPFMLTPPIFRVDPGKGQAIRVRYTGEPLPTDKETLFSFNVLEVPPKAKASEGRALLEFAFLTQIKLIFRPPALPGAASAAFDQMTWKLIPGADGKGIALQVSNPTPYYVNFAHVGLKVGERRYLEQGGMVAPAATSTFQITKLVDPPGEGAKATFDTINDYGAIAAHEKPLSP